MLKLLGSKHFPFQTPCRNFLWSSKCSKVGWEIICLPKLEGGLGLKNRSSWNKALLFKILWNIHMCKDTLWIRWVHSIYLRGEFSLTLDPKNWWFYFLQEDCFHPWSFDTENKVCLQHHWSYFFMEPASYILLVNGVQLDEN